LDVGVDHDRVPSLEQRVEQLHERDRVAGLVARREVVAFEHTRHRHARGEAEHVGHVHRVQPFRVVAHLQPVLVGEQDAARLIDVRGGVRVDLVGTERGARRGPAARVADAGGEIADDEHGDVAEVLERTELAQDDRRTQMDVRGGGVEPELHPQGPPGTELVPQLVLGDAVDGVGAQGAQLLIDVGPGHEVERYFPPAGRPGLTFGSSRTNQRHGCESPWPGFNPTRVERPGRRGGGTPSSSTRTGPRTRSVPFCAPVIARDCVRRAGPDARSRSRRATCRRALMTSIPSTGAPERKSTALAHPVSPHTTLAHQCMPYVKYTYKWPGGPNMTRLRGVSPRYAWLPGSSSPAYASTSTSRTATRGNSGWSATSSLLSRSGASSRESRA